MSARRATSETTAPGTKLSATIARFCSSLQRRRRSMPLITSTRAIAPSLAPVQTLSFALVLSPPASIPQGGPHRTGTVRPTEAAPIGEGNGRNGGRTGRPRQQQPTPAQGGEIGHSSLRCADGGVAPIPAIRGRRTEL